MTPPHALMRNGYMVPDCYTIRHFMPALIYFPNQFQYSLRLGQHGSPSYFKQKPTSVKTLPQQIPYRAETYTQQIPTSVKT